MAASCTWSGASRRISASPSSRRRPTRASPGPGGPDLIETGTAIKPQPGSCFNYGTASAPPPRREIHHLGVVSAAKQPSLAADPRGRRPRVLHLLPVAGGGGEA